MSSHLHRNKDWLIEKYHHDSLSQREVAEEAGVSRDTIKYWFKKHNISTRSLSDAHVASRGNDDPDGYEEHVLDGMLLGDGCLEYQGKSARYKLCVKHEEHAKWEKNRLDDMGFECKMRRVETTNNDPVWPGKATSYHMWTLNYPCLGELHKRWYSGKNGEKRIPDNINLTREGLLFWYVGDGSISEHYNKWQVIMSTNNFTQDGVLELVSKLRELGIHSQTNKKRPGQYVIRIAAASVPQLFKILGAVPDAIRDCYGYKWKAAR